jgi:hypothetical protein
MTNERSAISAVPPIRREVLVDAGPDTAFDVFTAGIGRWWPIAGHSVHGAGGTVAFTGGQLVERSAAGEQCVWGTVTRWEPPAVVAFTWYPGRTPERSSHVEVTFTATGPPGTGQLARATMLATEDDVSVAQGFFAVTVRPWQVMMQAWPG